MNYYSCSRVMAVYIHYICLSIIIPKHKYLKILNLGLIIGVTMEIIYLFLYSSSSSSTYPTKWGRYNIFFHSFLSLFISMLIPFILMSSFTQSIHLYHPPLLGCSTFIFITLLVMCLSSFHITWPYQANILNFSVTATFKLPLFIPNAIHSCNPTHPS
jgi:hypothetical protein